MALPIYREKPQTTDVRYEGTSGSMLQVASGVDRLRGRLGSNTKRMQQLAEPEITQETVESALQDVKNGDINSEKVARIAQNVYRKTATHAYLADIEVQGEELSSKIEARQAASGQYNATSFTKAWDAFTKSSLKGVKDAQIRESVESNLQSIGAKKAGAISVMQARQSRTRQKNSITSQYKLYTERAKKASIANPQEALLYSQKAEGLLQSMVDAGMIDGATAELQTMETNKAITQELVLNGYLKSDNKTAFLEEIYTNDMMSATEKKEAIDYIKSDISNKNAIEKGLEEKIEIEDEVSTERIQFNVKSRLVDGTLDQEYLDLAFKADSISLEDHTKYSNRMHTVGVGVSDPEEYHNVSVTLGSQTSQTIYDNELLSNSDKEKLVSKLNSAMNWQNSPRAKQANDEIKGMFGVPKGTIIDKLDFDNQLTKDLNMMDSAIYDEVEALPLEERATKSLNITRKWMKEYQDGLIPGTQPYKTKETEEKKKAELNQAKKEDDGSGKSSFRQFLEWL